MKTCFLQHIDQTVLIQKLQNAFYMNRHIIPGRGLVRIAVPACTYISMRAGKHTEDLGIFLKRLVMIGLSHDMAGQKQFSISGFYEYRHLRGYGSIILSTCSQESKRMCMNEVKNYLLVGLFEIGKIIHH